MALKDAIANLKTANDSIETANELSEAQRIKLLQQINMILMTMLLGLLEKQK